MGWLDLPGQIAGQLADWTTLAEELRAEGTRHVVVLGMGGSSLAPDVFRRTFGSRPDFPELVVLDSTHPEAVSALRRRIDPAHTFFLVSSKSGTTLEPLAFLQYFWEATRSRGVAPGPHFAAVTDPGTPLEALARSKGFRAVFRATPTVGGRYSALSAFGMVPAALVGVDVGGLLGAGALMAEACGASVAESENPGLGLGAVLGTLAAGGRDKLTFLTTPDLAAFPMWAEQLVAESTGKLGRGIVPVVDEPQADPAAYGTDRLFVAFFGSGTKDGGLARRADRLEAAGQPLVRLEVPRLLDLGQEFFRWEMAVASAGMVLGIDPYDQPDVEFAKELARQAMALPASETGTEELLTVPATAPDELSAQLHRWKGRFAPGMYIGIQAYLAPTPQNVAGLDRARKALLEQLQAVTTLGFGPRFLHSTGQLHKGGPGTALFLQLVDHPGADLQVPGERYSFGQIIRAQAIGDYQALQQKHRAVLRVDLGSDVSGGLGTLLQALDA